MSEQTAQATIEELTQRCGHECLSAPDHDGPHLYGYRGGPYSYEGLLARVEELETACSELTTENLRLDAQRAELARELLTAAQHERSRLATADHQRDLANRWLDMARSALPAPPTAEEVAGLFGDG